MSTEMASNHEHTDGQSMIPPARVHVGCIPRWNMNDLARRPCPVCGDSKSESLCQRPDGLVVVACQVCGMMFVREMPSEEQLAAYYQDYAATKGRVREPRPSWFRCVSGVARNFYIEAMENTGGLAGRTVLDIGCSTGDFLELVRFRGGCPQGVEIDVQSREAAQARGLTVHTAIPQAAQYDVTCALQVLEHLTNPGVMVDAMARATKPEGRVVLGVPNASEAPRVGLDWLGFRVDLEHFNYFTVTTLAELLRRHGLLVEHFWEHRQASITRTDIEPWRAPLTWRQRARDRIDREAIRFLRTLLPRPERFIEGTFVLSLVARKA